MVKEIKSRLKVAVVMGGDSAEREVSLHSGEAVAQGLRDAGCDVIEVTLESEDLSAFNGYDGDAIFIALHGGFGEDGRVQRRLKERGLVHTGSGPLASERAMNKLLSKSIFAKKGVPMPRYIQMEVKEAEPEIKKKVAELGYPVVVKPVAQGSSIGVTIVEDETELRPALRLAFRYGDRGIVEEYIDGREITVGMLEDEALPIIELKPRRKFFDYTAKYQHGATEYIVRPHLTEKTRRQIKEAALSAYKALGCSGFSRVDMMLTKENQPVVLEVNTIPGFTSTSLVPMAAKAVGISFPQLCLRIVKLAIEAYGEK